MGLTDRTRVVLIGAVLAALVAGPAAAQQPLDPGEGFEQMPRVGIGYVANAPNIFAGAVAYVVLDVFGGLGLYVDGKLKLDDPSDREDFIDTLSVTQVSVFPGQREFDDGFGWWSVNVGVVRPISPELMIYAGAGYTEESVYIRYVDDPNILDIGVGGRYWVQDLQQSGEHLNLLAGLFFRMTEHVALQFGVETQPQGVSVGGSYSIPF